MNKHRTADIYIKKKDIKMCVNIFFLKVDLDISHSKANEQQFTVCDSVGNTRENRFLNPLTLES